MSNPKWITQNLPDAETLTALTSFKTQCLANDKALNLVAADLTEINKAVADYATGYNGWITAKQTAKFAQDNKDQVKKATRAVVTKFAKKFRADSSVPDALLAQLMVPPHVPHGVKTPPTIPSAFLAKPSATGEVKLTWQANGNTSGTTYILESRNAPTEDWAYLDSTSKRSYVQSNVAPGTYTEYRVSAKRNSQQSSPSQSAVIYGSGVGASLRLAA